MNVWACVASGPSLVAEDVEALRGRATVIACNSSWEIAPFCDYIYASDGWWWRNNLEKLADHPAQRWTSDARTAEKLGLLHHNSLGASNSGLRAIELAVKLGASTVLLLGYDCKAINGRVHHHPDHPAGRNPSEPKFKIWREQFRVKAPQFERAGVRVVNCSRDTALEAFPRARLADELQHIQR